MGRSRSGSRSRPTGRVATDSRDGQSRPALTAARRRGAGGSRRAQPLPSGAGPALVAMAGLMLVPIVWGVGTMMQWWGPAEPAQRERVQGVAWSLVAAGGSLAAVCLAMAWWVRRQRGGRVGG